MFRINAARLRLAFAVVALLAPAVASRARVKLVTLPARDAITINLDHPMENLIIEERVIALEKGTNHIDFSWKGVSIDPNTIQLAALDHPDDVRIVNVSYPPNEDALVWEVYSEKAREERVRIYYLLSGLLRTMSYRAVADKDETAARVEARFKLANRSGEEFEDARIVPGFGENWTRSIRDGATREMLSYAVEAMPVVKRYIYRPTGGRPDFENVPLYHEIKNEEARKLGKFKMLGGKVRIFMKDPSGSQIFLGEDWMKDLPVQEKAELSLGTARDVVIRRNVMDDEREVRQRNTDRKIVLYDRIVTLRYEIENFKDEPVELKIEEPIQDYWVLESVKPSSVKAERKDATTLELLVPLEPSKRDKADEETKKLEVFVTYRQKNQMNR